MPHDFDPELDAPRAGAPEMGNARINRLDLSGEGVTAGGTRIPFTLPGERIRILAGRSEPVLDAVLEPAPERVEPPCRHFRACGGCTLQHASDAFLVKWKQGIVRAALAARGLDAPFRPPHFSPPGARRRAVFAGRRTRKTTIVGFRAARSHEIVPVEMCPVSCSELIGALPILHALTGLGASRSAAIRLTVIVSDTGLDLAVGEAKPLDGPLRSRLAATAEAHDLARLAWNGEVVAYRRPPWQSFGRARVVPPPGGFLQATADGEAALVRDVRDAVGSARRVADLFAGAGTLSLPLAEAAEVHAVEAVPETLAALDAGWRAAPGLRRVTTEVRDLFRRPLLAAELSDFDAVAVDPPRAGAEAQIRQLVRSPVPRVAALSCNPVTFARDAAILVEGGFRLDWIRIIDQFRWSPHVELAASFVRV